jgi:hypothetical protein
VDRPPRAAAAIARCGSVACWAAIQLTRRDGGGGRRAGVSVTVVCKNPPWMNAYLAELCSNRELLSNSSLARVHLSL